MADLCAGHGLVGLIFALCEERVTRVELVDERRPQTFDRIFEAFVDLAPWVADKVSYREEGLTTSLRLPREAGVTLVHACGPLTDLGLSIAASGIVRSSTDLSK